MRNTVDRAVHTLALFAMANLVLGLFANRWNANWLWVDGGPIPAIVVNTLVLLFTLGTLWLENKSPRLARATRWTTALLACACLVDTLTFYRLLAAGSLKSSLPIPLSLPIAALLLWSAAVGRRPPEPDAARTRRALWIRVTADATRHAAPLALAALGVLAHILSFGSSDYRRPADAALVLGAAVRANGEASPALRDRTLTACELYKQGLVGRLVLSGGHGPHAPISEPVCMARIARAQGIPESALILDETGARSTDSIRATRALAVRDGWKRILLVSHDYHLARLKLLSHRAGLEAYTVPATESVAWDAKPRFIAREVAAWAWWYLRPDSV